MSGSSHSTEFNGRAHRIGSKLDPRRPFGQRNLQGMGGTDFFATGRTLSALSHQFDDPWPHRWNFLDVLNRRLELFNALAAVGA